MPFQKSKSNDDSVVNDRTIEIFVIKLLFKNFSILTRENPCLQSSTVTSWILVNQTPTRTLHPAPLYICRRRTFSFLHSLVDCLYSIYQMFVLHKLTKYKYSLLSRTSQ
uniref:Uncharacterized protein n=1 Tax=Glossina brevipalpis TaxID=37001 RepID=A0A1A9WA53_9MUSC